MNAILNQFITRPIRKLFSFRNYFKSDKIDIMANMMESLSASHEILRDLIYSKGNKEDVAVIEYLNRVKYPPVGDFQKGLEWFNVSEPLSFSKHLKGKVVVLDFFTYCCINCMHILPELKELEQEFSIEDGLVVIGVHSAKFENEKDSKNVLAAVQRYNITHPVVNDCKNDMWRNCEVHCWPTLVILGPHANPLIMLTGEGHKEDLRLYIKNILKFYKGKKEISNHNLPLESANHFLPNLKGPFLFPGKITSCFDADRNLELLAVSDTGNNRVLILDYNGTVLEKIGGNEAGLADGHFENCLFNAPQGLVFQNHQCIYIADTENHAIRKIDLKRREVETVAGTGKQGHDYKGGKMGRSQEISSPWDVCVYKTQNGTEVLVIAMAGTHQIWALFLNDTVWWKGQKYPAGTCVCIAGSGREQNKNSSYPHTAAFSQPSGLALHQQNLFIADSESSSVRKLCLETGVTSAVVGGDRNPLNLFAFGDKDGKSLDAKLQHPVGVGICSNQLFVTDTYNHKLKKIDMELNTVKTMMHEGKPIKFNEPGGVCGSSDGKSLYVADTNDHHIKVLSLNPDEVTCIKSLDFKDDGKVPVIKIDKTKYKIVTAPTALLSVQGGKLILKIDINFSEVSLTPDSPQKWFCDLPSLTWSCLPLSNNSIEDVDVVVSVPSEPVEKCVDFLFDLIICCGDVCLPKKFIVRQPVRCEKNADLNSSSNLKVLITQRDVKLQ